MDFFVATKNAKKLIELKRILTPLGINPLCEKDFDRSFPEVIEDGETFEENAMIKALAGVRETGLPTIADDSGLCVTALNNAPGVYSARYAGEPCNDLKNNQKLLEAMKDVPNDKRDAFYVCAIACAFPDGRSFTVRGECNGKIAYDMKGTNGFGYDVLFISELGRFAEISDKEKDGISHRGKSLLLLAEKLKEYLKDE